MLKEEMLLGGKWMLLEGKLLLMQAKAHFIRQGNNWSSS